MSGTLVYASIVSDNFTNAFSRDLCERSAIEIDIGSIFNNYRKFFF
jgi:hypothetical protein